MLKPVSTLEVLQEFLNQFFAPVLRRKLDPYRLVGNNLIDSTWLLLMLPETQGCLSNRNSAHEKTQLRTLGRVWPSGRDEVASFRISLALISETKHPNSWKKVSPCSRDSSRPPERLQEWHWVLSINHVLGGQEPLCYSSVDLFSIRSSSPSSSGFN